MARTGFDQSEFDHHFKGAQFMVGMVEVENHTCTDRTLYLILKIRPFRERFHVLFPIGIFKNLGLVVGNNPGYFNF
jgi:hypothetical protein